MDDLPYRAEYAKSGRAGCKLCKGNIGQGTLRMAAMVQSAFHDGRDPKWFHFKCFFQKQRPKALGDIAKVAELKMDDQDKIRKEIGEFCGFRKINNKNKTMRLFSIIQRPAQEAMR